MAITKVTRKKMEDLIYKVFDALDKEGANSARYRSLFKKMSDKDFDSFFKNHFNKGEYLVLEVVDYERDLKLSDVKKAADVLGVPLFERVIMPNVNKDLENPVVSKFEVPVGYVHLKRMQQTLSKKNTTSTEISSRSALTGQVVGKDKNARDSDVENFALVTTGQTDTLRELLGPRSDDMVMKSEMYSAIAQKEFVSLDTLTNNIDNKTTVNALDVHLIAMGIKSNLITEGLLLKKSLK